MATRGRLAVSKYKVCDVILVSSSFLLLSINQPWLPSSFHLLLFKWPLMLYPTGSCSNVNFAFRGVCNRCGSARPSGAAGSGAGSIGRGRGRGTSNQDSGGNSRQVGGPTGLFGPNDWPCPM